MALPGAITTLRDNTDAVLVPAGTYLQGIAPGELARLVAEHKEQPDPIFATELPVHNVRLRECYIDRTPVTNRRYADFIAQTGHPAPAFWGDPRFNRPDRPVVGVTYRDAEAYCRWAQKRLPTEDEWEAAARGPDGRIWPWGNVFSAACCNSRESAMPHTTEVDRYPNGASPVGCLDMAGNIWEMTTSVWEEYSRAIRGGSFANPALFCRTTTRWGVDPAVPGTHWLGFRCIMDLAKARIYGRARTA